MNTLTINGGLQSIVLVLICFLPKTLWRYQIDNNDVCIVQIIIIIIVTFTSSVLEGVHKRQSLYKVFSSSQGNLKAKET